MEGQLQQVLRSFCFNTGWKYAVFWKLKHRARMMFTWEDVYYDNNGCRNEKLLNEMEGSSSEVSYSCDPLGLALANMSYEVYSVGEGIVGQVAVSGKHSWIFSNQHFADSSSSSECYGGWQAQFSAGIKTITVVAVIPHGVVQLGSLHKIAEDLKLVDQIRKAILNLQDPLPGCILSSMKNRTSDKFTRISDSECHDCHDLNDLGKRLEIVSMPPVENVRIGQSSLYDATLLTDNPQMVACNPLLEFLNPSVFQDQVDIHVPKLRNLHLHQAFENREQPTKSGHVEKQISPFSYSVGYELFEALGPSFQKQNDFAQAAEETDSNMAIDISEGTGICSLPTESTDTHLLDAVVAKVSRKGDETGSEKSCCDTRESLLTSSITSAGYSFDQEMSSSSKLVASGVESLMSCPSTSSSKGSGHLNRAPKGVKTNKKRAGPGEGSRPRPRDRQLIQDRIKELRELIPNGSKCSIDSLLEQTIKHMLFLQSITKHAENLSKCAVSKLLDKDTGMQRFSCCEQGSSWAVDVGSNQKFFPIIVENINMNGQMLVEMLCNECSQFLEIGDTIQSLGLSILKGVSEACGNKTWMCFLVEGQNDRSMHRMDVLWSLVQLLQPKISH